MRYYPSVHVRKYARNKNEFVYTNQLESNLRQEEKQSCKVKYFVLRKYSLSKRV